MLNYDQKKKQSTEGKCQQHCSPTYSLPSIIESKYQHKIFIFLKDVPPQPRQQCIHHSSTDAAKETSTQMTDNYHIRQSPIQCNRVPCIFIFVTHHAKHASSDRHETLQVNPSSTTATAHIVDSNFVLRLYLRSDTVHASVTRGNNFKLVPQHCKYDLRKYYFTHRVVPIWNHTITIKP